MRLLRMLIAIVVPIIAAGLALILGELGLRLLDGQPVSQLSLPIPRMAPLPRATRLDPHIGGSLPAEIDPVWLDEPPPRFPKPPTDAELEQRARTWRDPEVRYYETFRIWNRSLVRAQECRPGNKFLRMPQPLLVFDSLDGRPSPPHRYLPSRTLPGGLMTNRYGWRGPDLPLDKPPATIRLAFVGASTTVGLWTVPVSYPEYVVHWLNRWAERAGFAVRFDGINAGREGLGSVSIVDVAIQEALPLEPDLFVYYEGANQSLCHQRVAGYVPPRPGRARRAIDWLVERTYPYLQSARRTKELLQWLDTRDGAEPPKPRVTESWFPPGLDEAAPDISEAGVVPKEERQILEAVAQLRERLAADGSALVLTSFVWLVRDGLRLDPQRSQNIYNWLNVQCWPHTYRDLRRGVDLHNRILQRFALAHDLPFIDLARDFPDDPALFVDAVHLSLEGTKLQAWLVFRALVPLIRGRIESGEWPRPDRVALAEHPNIRPPERHMIDCRGAADGTTAQHSSVMGERTLPRSQHP